MKRGSRTRCIIARILISIVFISNMYCAVTFVLDPASQTGAYQLAGEGARAAIAGLGIAFAMWNATYIPIIASPNRFRAVFGIVLAQQVIGLVGETWIYTGLGASQAILASSILRFIIFDIVGLILLLVAFLISMRG